MASSTQNQADDVPDGGPQQAAGLQLEVPHPPLHDDPLKPGRDAGRTIVTKLFMDKALQQCDGEQAAFKELTSTLKGASLQWLCKEYYQVWGESRRTLTCKEPLTSEEELRRLVEQCRSTKNVTCFVTGRPLYSELQDQEHDALPCWVPIIVLSDVLTKLREVHMYAQGCFQLLHVMGAMAGAAAAAAAAPSSRSVAPATLAGRLEVLKLEDYEHVMGAASWQQLGKLTALQELSLTCKRFDRENRKACEQAAASAARRLQALSKLTLHTDKESASDKELLRAFLSGLDRPAADPPAPLG